MRRTREHQVRRQHGGGVLAKHAARHRVGRRHPVEVEHAGGEALHRRAHALHEQFGDRDRAGQDRADGSQGLRRGEAAAFPVDHPGEGLDDGRRQREASLVDGARE